MKDEIKEIINQLEIVARKHTIEVCEDGSKIETMPASVVDELRLNNYSSKILLDYITYLQEELEEQKRIEQADFKTIQNLEEENERLKENNKKKTSRCTERNHRIRTKERILERRNKKISKLEKQLDKYKNVIDKIKEISSKHIDNANKELQIILKYSNDLEYKNQCSHDFEIIKQNVEIIYNNILELLEEVE